ncbi:MAG TPA: hypothetical protein VFX98_15130 [Longimicrobiaceae bacterium]|nr:hypothetical protein [Longimicrobiaceae bacterium]
MSTPTIDYTTATLEECLLDFQQRFNENARVKKLIPGWNRKILIEPTDVENPIHLVISDNEMREVSPGMVEDPMLVHMQADEETFKRVWTGDINPATALIDGTLAVFSDERDKVKLEAIAMVIWGL